MTDVLEAPARPAVANFVGGEWRPGRSGRTYEKRGPWRPSEVIGEFPASDAADVDEAVQAAAVLDRVRAAQRLVQSREAGPHEQGRAAMEFYTEVVTVYEDV